MDLEHLRKLNDLKFQRSQKELASLLEREEKLRRELTKLRGFIEEVRSLPAEQARFRAVGADVIWMRWIAAAQSRYNIELAQVLAQKESYLMQHKRAFGKAQVSQALAERARQKAVQEKRNRMLTASIERTAQKNN